MSDGKPGDTNGEGGKPRSMSFFSALLQRSTSFRGDDQNAVGADDSPLRQFRRTQSMSEPHAAENNEQALQSASATPPNSDGAHTAAVRRPSLTSALLGHAFMERHESVHSHTLAGVESVTSQEEVEERETSTSEQQENLTQNDHLNKRLLSSFLEKLNLSDPVSSSSTNDTSNSESHAFSDDFLIDRICKRLESEKK